jgi:hypothetical protein
VDRESQAFMLSPHEGLATGLQSFLVTTSPIGQKSLKKRGSTEKTRVLQYELQHQVPPEQKYLRWQSGS